MAGQLAAIGAQALANHIGGVVPPALINGSLSPTNPVWIPGLVAIDYSVTPPVRYHWNTTAWIAGVAPLYIALLVGDPTVSGPNGGYARSISDLVEDTTAGYARQAVAFAPPAAYSSSVTYTVGQQIDYQGFVYSCAVATISGTPPSILGASDSNWNFIAPDYPATVSNTSTLTFSYSADQAFPVNWAALVTAQTGNLGLLEYLWATPAPQQVKSSQSIQIGAGAASVTQG